MGERPKSGGRARGTPNRRTVASRRAIQEQADPLAFLARVMLGEVIDGHTPTMSERLNAARELRRVVVPDAKERSVTMMLPAISGPADLPAAMSAVMAAVAGGDLTLGEGKAFADLLDGMCKAYEVADLAQRIANLEERQS